MDILKITVSQVRNGKANLRVQGRADNGLIFDRWYDETPVSAISSTLEGVPNDLAALSQEIEEVETLNQAKRLSPTSRPIKAQRNV